MSRWPYRRGRGCTVLVRLEPLQITTQPAAADLSSILMFGLCKDQRAGIGVTR